MPTQELSGESGNPRDPFVSPLHAGPGRVASAYIQAWSDETLLKDSRLFADRAQQAGADVRIDLLPGQPHTFQMAVGRSKDADEAMRRLADSARPKLGPRSRDQPLEKDNGNAHAGDRDLQLDMAWLVASRAWLVDPAPSARRVLIEAAKRLGDPQSADLRILAIQAYANPFGKAPAILQRLRDAAQQVHHDTDAARFFGPAAVAMGAFDLAAAFLGEVVEGLRTQGRLGHLPRMLTLQGSRGPLRRGTQRRPHSLATSAGPAIACARPMATAPAPNRARRCGTPATPSTPWAAQPGATKLAESSGHPGRPAISTHLYRIFPKFGITSRGELRSALSASTASGEHQESKIGAQDPVVMRVSTVAGEVVSSRP
jgi:hypothetical protein